jgi:hypothetical protein
LLCPRSLFNPASRGGAGSSAGLGELLLQLNEVDEFATIVITQPRDEAEVSGWAAVRARLQLQLTAPARAKTPSAEAA